MTAALFYLFAVAAMASAVGVVAFGNLVRSAVCLLFTLVSVAGIYLLLDAEFLAAVQLVVYTGGILILIIFGILLTSSSALVRYSPKFGEVVSACAVAAVLMFALVVVIHSSRFAVSANAPQPTVNDLGQALLGDYVLPFELASVLLLVVMIGAAFVARATPSPGLRRAQSSRTPVGPTAAGRGEGDFEMRSHSATPRNPHPILFEPEPQSRRPGYDSTELAEVRERGPEARA